MTILELDAEHRVGQQLQDFAAHLELFFLSQAISLLLPTKVAEPYSAPL
jgi:hypothetical protein